MSKANQQESRILPAGYRARAANKDDLNGIVEIANLAALETMGAEDTNADEILTDWKDPNFDLARDSQLVFSDTGNVVGVAEVFKSDAPPVKPYLWFRILPGEENSGVGDHLVAWGEASARKVFDDVPKGVRVAMPAHNVSGYAPVKELLDRHSLKVIRHSLQMRIEMKEAPAQVQWPEGIRLAPYDESKDLEAVYRAQNEAFRDHFGHIEESFEEGFPIFKRYMVEAEGYEPGLWFLAKDGDEIAGLSLCRTYSWEDKEMGWVMDLGVRRPWRKQGLGLALLQHSFAEYYRRGFRRVGLGVDASSLTGATRLYEKAGMTVHRQYDRYEKELRAGEELGKTELDE
jgi:GNAT superfamily N-acetyltransferase